MTAIIRPVLIEAPHLWPKGRTREGETTAPAVGISGYVTVELLHARTGLVKRRLTFKNLITDAALNALAAGSLTLRGNYFNGAAYVGVGTGTTAPAASDTDLQAIVGSRINTTGGFTEAWGAGTGYAYWYARFTRLFSETEGNGNLGEFGVFSAAAGGTMLARQLFKDDLGSPVVITKTAADLLKITYELRVHPPATATTGTLVIGGLNYPWSSLACDADGYAGPWHIIDTDNAYAAYGCLQIGEWGATNFAKAYDSNTPVAVTADPGGSSGTVSATTIQAYTSGATRDIEYRFDPATSNFAGGIGAIATCPWQNNAAFHMTFSTKLPKDATKRLTIMLRYTLARV